MCGVGIVDDDVEFVEVFQGVGQQLVYVGVFGDVGFGEDCMVVCCFDFFDYLQVVCFVDIGYYYGGVFMCIGFGDVFIEI